MIFQPLSDGQAPPPQKTTKLYHTIYCNNSDNDNDNDNDDIYVYMYIYI